MKWLLFLFPFVLIANEPDPLMPLIPGDPLTLNADLYELLYKTDHAKENERIFNARQFPWVQAGLTVIILGLTPFILSAYQKRLRPKVITRVRLSTLEELKERFSQLEEEKDPKEKIDHLSDILRESYSHTLNRPGATFTFEEIVHKIKEAPDIARTKTIFKKVEFYQFSSNTPEKKDWDELTTFTKEKLNPTQASLPSDKDHPPSEKS